MVVEAAIVWAAAGVAGLLGHWPRVSLWLERALGVTFIGLALRLAAERR